MPVSLQGVGYRYRGAEESALTEVSLTVERGSLVSVVGPNGSGKSTLMKILARVVEASAGEVRFDGESLGRWDRRAYARRVGYLPQSSDALFPTRAIDVVLSGRAPFLRRFEWESERDVQRARQALAECDAATLAERPMDQMSGGERKRVALARVLAGEPDLVLLDEPLSSLDLAHVEQLARLLRSQVEGAGRTVILVSHDLNWSAAVADRMIVMAGGRVLADGAPNDVLDRSILRTAFGIDARVVEHENRRWILPASMGRGRTGRDEP